MPKNKTRVVITQSLLHYIENMAKYSPRPGYEKRNRLHWIIAGGESGHNARPMHPDWARSIRDQCLEAGVPFFMK